MARGCNLCPRTFLTERAYNDHNINVHRFPMPPRQHAQISPHPQLNGMFSDQHSVFGST